MLQDRHADDGHRSHHGQNSEPASSVFGYAQVQPGLGLPGPLLCRAA
jgi:hypothetical protein